MRTLILVGLALIFASGAEAASIKKIELNEIEVLELQGVQTWLDENLSAEDCPERLFYAVFSGKRRPVHVGYEVQVECPETPQPHVALFFDSEQNYIEPRNSL